MAAVSIVSEVNFRLTVQRLSRLDAVCSPEFLIQDVPWKVCISKIIEENNEFFALDLICESEKKPPEWTQAAVVSFQFLPSIVNIKEYQSEPYIFDCTKNRRRCTLIRWIDLFDKQTNYVINDIINLKINVEASSLNESRSGMTFESIDNCCEDGRVGTFRLTVSNIVNLMAVRTPPFKLRSLPWYLTIYKHLSDLRLRLEAGQSSNELIYNVNLSAKIISPNEQSRQQTIQAKVIRRIDGLSMERLILWDDLIKPENGFIDNGSIELEVEVSAELLPEQTVKSNGRKRNINNQPSKMIYPRMECPICETTIENQDVSVISCGHMFCTICIRNAIERRKLCPIQNCGRRCTINQMKPLHLPIVGEPQEKRQMS